MLVLFSSVFALSSNGRTQAVMVRCNLCNQEFGRITETHLWYKHKIHFPRFIKLFPNANERLVPWNKDKTKETHPSLFRLSRALKAKKEWNFSKWQGDRKINYVELGKNKTLAELIGIILGDGNLYKHSRTDNLRIICNSQDKFYIQHIVKLIKNIFKKEPSVIKRKNENTVVISLYQCAIIRRLSLPAGNKITNNVGIPSWISLDKKYMVQCLKGLFETDGCFQEDKNNYTQYIELKNNCKKLREDAYKILLKLGFTPQFGKNYVRLAKRNEVYKFKDLIDFRNYICPLG